MESLAEEPDPAFCITDMPEPEEDAGTTDQLPVNVTTINASADPSGDPFAVTAVLSRQLSVTRKEWLKYTANREDPDAPLYTQGTLAKALQTPGNEHLVTNTSFLTACPPPEPNGIFSFAAKFKHRHRSVFGLPILKPTSKVSVWQGIVMTILDGTYSAFLVPISIAFSSDLNHWSWTTIVDVVAGFLFTLDIVLLFHTGFIITCNFRKRLIMDGYFVARYYAKHASLLVDVLATVPAWIEFLVLVFLKRHTPPLLLVLLNYMRLFRLLRLMRFLKNMFASSSGQLGKRLNAWVSSTVLYLTSIIYAAAALINFFGCLWYWVARREGLTNSWLTDVGGADLSNDSDIRQWVVALYFAMTTVTTVGYGDITAHSTVEQCVATVMMLAGVVFFGILIGSLGEIVQHASTRARQAQMFRRKFEDVETWMRMRRLPKYTQKKIRNYYAEVWVRHADWKEAEFFDELPAHLRGEVAVYLMEEVFEQSDFFSQLPEGAKTRLAARLTPQMVPPGHDLCQEGDDADCMWILQEGEVLALRHTKEAELLPAPAVIGEAVILRDQLPAASIRPCTFRALGSCTVWHLALKDIQTLAHVYPEMLLAMVEAFTGRWEHHLDAMGPDKRQQAQASKAALQAAADTVAAISTPHKRRTTAETATQYMLGDLDSEPLTAFGHAQQRQEAQSLARLSIGTSASDDDPSWPPESALSGLHGEASAGMYGYAQTGHGHLPAGPHGHAPSGHGLKGLIQAQGQPSKAFDRGRKGFEAHKSSTHPMPDVKYSEIECQVTEAEDEEMQRQASVMPLPAGAGPHGQRQSLSQSQPPGSWSNKQYQQSSSGARQAPIGTASDNINILVMAGPQDAGVPGSNLSDGRNGPGFGGPTGLDSSKGRAGGQQLPSHRVRSPLQSIHEDHEMGRRSGGVTGTGSPKSFSRQISHSSDFMLSSGGWMAGAFAGRLLHRQRMHDSSSSTHTLNVSPNQLSHAGPPLQQ
ncbi:TPA: hypothetical protein ACH3X2_012094 [Trebouxia sp. C0005]